MKGTYEKPAAMTCSAEKDRLLFLPGCVLSPFLFSVILDILPIVINQDEERGGVLIYAENPPKSNKRLMNSRQLQAKEWPPFRGTSGAEKPPQGCPFPPRGSVASLPP